MADRVFDVLIVGAGPGGSNAAAACLSRGLTVAQVDARAFPRVKPCAGGLTPKSLAALQCGIEECSQGTSDRLSFGIWNAGAHQFRHSKSILYFVHRPDFDHWLVLRNLTHPDFRFFPAEPALAVEYRDGFRLETSARTLIGRQLIGADGSYGIVNRAFDITRPLGRATAVEVEVPGAADVPGSEDPRFDFGLVDQGYGWVFPKRDYRSVGIYTLADSTHGLRKTLTRYLEQLGFGACAELAHRGHRYPVGGHAFRLPSVPVYLVGDAGGFAEAVTGEGIYHALESGRLAAQCASDVAAGTGNSRAYYRRLKHRVLWDTHLSWKFSGIFYRNPDGWLRLFRNPLGWRTLLEGYADGANLADCVFWSALYFLRSWRPGVGRADLPVDPPT